METIEELKKLLESASKEIDIWRKDFLEERFLTTFKFIPEEDKQKIRTYFLCTPSESFTNPWQQWNDSICVLLQWKYDERGK